MAFQDQDIFIVFSHASLFLNQNDLLSLSLTSKKMHDMIAIPRLYSNIHITKNPVLRTNKWFLDGGKTYVSGYRSVLKTGDKNDIFLYDRIERLLETSHLRCIKQLTIDEDLFHNRKEGLQLLQRLVNEITDLDVIESLDIKDPTLFELCSAKYYRLSSLKKRVIYGETGFDGIKLWQNFKSLKWQLPESLDLQNVIIPEVGVMLMKQLNGGELEIKDEAYSSLRVFEYFDSLNLRFKNLRRLKLNHVHKQGDGSATSMRLSSRAFKDVVNLSNLKALELEFSCEVDDCECDDDFLQDITGNLVSLTSLGFIEKTFTKKGYHYMDEKWDLVVNKFILNLPNVSKDLRLLSIRHDPPLNGKGIDTVDGNLLRRKKLYEKVLPKLTSLETIIAPTVLQSITSYEMYACDLLWNGCKCAFCSKYLPLFDKYIMNHQYFSTPDARYLDIIPIVFAAYTGKSLAKRFDPQKNWDLDLLQYAPEDTTWNFHGFERIHHFASYECYFDESSFEPLATIISHFFYPYMNYLIKILPNLRQTMLSGIYFSVSPELHTYETIYD
ncbi:CEI_1a_G0042580.mRNA.1.CDS.1 [Saccharomyces cerevisiae]|nr:EM14S01-3B_G0024740.mRNA.1.CDS.1 [Saccharomyces cerevisiae]CAI4646962.1 AMH_1a_G0042680.mRNA.1.CDS.1 [Saccharomyces cerevisiae]CAI4651072.1 CEI_1a_G0042580.mRNA.1.CDS.1 [Saccharomyces cerevisiae]CAI6811466.1 AMH_1a_G0042680.mRNA.1.CDS.1 [Saccharomyces cerevisiae]CAI7411821.1 CEI_1a_G0042580.mRNA.1.CDS.1 [Saccharomyces cerevisiae]